MTIDEALAYMGSLVQFSPRKDFARFRALLTRLGDPHQALKTIHIAGTNGKGSVTTQTATILRAAGYRVGAYLSPYVFALGERWMIDGAPLPLETIAPYVGRLRPEIEALAAELGPTTEFELKTALAFLAFAEAGVDYAVIEVGIGGRLDSTNVIPPPLVAAITSIGYDHMNLLGETLPEIAGEKAGILKHGTTACVTGVPPGPALDVIAARAADVGVPLVTVSAADLPPTLQPALRGAHQRTNAAVAQAIALVLRERCGVALPDTAIVTGLTTATLPGRFQRAAAGRLILDGAHNPDGAAVLAATLSDEYPGERFVLVAGTKRGHEPGPFLETLAPLVTRVIATEPPFKPTPVADIVTAAEALGLPVTVGLPAREAIISALASAAPGARVVVAGSFYLVGETPTELL